MEKECVRKHKDVGNFLAKWGEKRGCGYIYNRDEELCKRCHKRLYEFLRLKKEQYFRN